MGKEYPSDHQLEDISKRKFGLLFSEHLVNEQTNDYGFDFEVRLTMEGPDNQRVASGTSFYIQLKASESLIGEDVVKYDLETDLLLNQCLKSPVPAVLVMYDDSQNEFYWRILQPYCWNTLDKENQGWRDQQTVRISMSRDPLSENIDTFEDKITTASRHISIKHNEELSFVSDSMDDEGELERVRNQCLKQYMNSTLEKGKRLLQEGKEENALRCFAQVFEESIPTESKLQAGIKLLETTEADHTDPKKLAERGEVLTSAMLLAKKYDYDAILQELNQERELVMPQLQASLIGSRFKNTEINEAFTVVDVQDWLPPSEGMYPVAIQQYDDGVLYDESATGLIKSATYLRLSESGPTVEQACKQAEHDFNKDGLRIDSDPAVCNKCHLSSPVLMEICNHDLPFVCSKCDQIRPSESFCEGYICEDCNTK